MSRVSRFLLILAVVAAASCREAPEAPSEPEIVAMASPAAARSGEPHLETGPDGALHLSWIERNGSNAAVRVASFDGEKWSEPVTVVERDDLFVNWADFPSVHALDADSLAVHWLQKSGEGTYAYDVRIARSDDGGKTWGTPLTPHDDGTQTEHGFVSLGHREGSQELEAVWLDGRAMAADEHGHGTGDMTLRWASIRPDGSVADGRQLDERTCECCQTAMTMTPSGPVVAYRDRSENEVRDIAVVRHARGEWTAPHVVHADGWEIGGCPVNGPQLDARGNEVALAWFTAAGGDARVNVAFSNDAGASWSKPVRVDGGSPVGRVDVLHLGGGRALVTWLEGSGSGAEIRSRFIGEAGAEGPPLVVARTSAARAAGFPRTALVRDRVYYAWTPAEDPPSVRLAWAKVK